MPFPATGLIAYWNLDEPSGNRADSFGSSPLVPTGAPGSVAGKIGNAASFAVGSGSYLTSTNAALNLSTTDSWSLSVWAYVLNASNYRVLLSPGAGGSGKITILAVMTSGRFWRWAEYDSGISLTASTWTHLVYTFTSGGTNTGTEQWYRNGSALTSRTGAVPAPTSGTFRVGTVTGGVDSWEGYLDELGFWRRALSGSEVTDLYNGGAGITYTPAVTQAPRSMHQRRLRAVV